MKHKLAQIAVVIEKMKKLLELSEKRAIDASVYSTRNKIKKTS